MSEDRKCGDCAWACWLDDSGIGWCRRVSWKSSGDQDGDGISSVGLDDPACPAFVLKRGIPDPPPKPDPDVAGT